MVVFYRYNLIIGGLVFIFDILNIVASQSDNSTWELEVESENSTVMLAAQDQEETRKANPLNKGSLSEMVAWMRLQDGVSNYKAPGFDRNLVLDQKSHYMLHWKTNYAHNKIRFKLSINTSSSKFRPGFDIFALGFSGNGSLEGSDFCLIWYDLAHKLHLQDAFTDSNNQLTLVDQDRSACRLLKSAHKDAKQPLLLDDESVVISDQDEQEEDEAGATGDKQHGHIEINFRRPLDVCDFINEKKASPNSYYNIDNGTTHLVWFTLRGPLISIEGLGLNAFKESGTKLSSHQLHNSSSSGNQSMFEFGMRRVQLVTSDTANQVITSGAKLAFRMDAFQVPAQETTYWCKLLKLPHKFESKTFHMTSYEAVVEAGNEHIVHHMELYSCANLNSSQRLELNRLYSSGGWSGDCGSPQRPPATEPCKRVVMAWAMGARPLVYPPEVGQLIGGHSYSPFMMLEVHYNNEARQAGLVDSSGMAMRYTSKLRAHDAGILEVGLEYSNKNSIPPNMVAPLAGHCISECTRLAFGAPPRSTCQSTGIGLNNRRPTKGGSSLNDGIHVFAGQLHTHLTGVASWTEHIRQGELLGELQRDDHYSPHFQEIRMLPKTVHVAPGDALVHYCLYDTRSRSNITLGGFATTDEMCVTYLHYYPQLDLEVCKSSIDSSALEAYFKYLASDEAQQTSKELAELHPSSKTAHSVAENYRSIEWSKRRSDELLQLYQEAPLSVQCIRSDGSRHAGFWNGLEPTKVGWPSKLQLGADKSHEQLANYRGQGFHKRHERCLRTS